MPHLTLSWLPPAADFRQRCKLARDLRGQAAAEAVTGLARLDLDFVQTGTVDRLAQGIETPTPALRLAILSSSTTEHLHASLRVAGLRHRVPVEIFQCEYGQYLQELLDPGSKLHAFGPDVVLIALDARHLAAGAELDDETRGSDAPVRRALERIETLWRLARERLGAVVLQQAVLPVHVELLGGNEHRLASSPVWFVERLNVALRQRAGGEPGEAGASHVHIVSVDRHAARDGLAAWHDPAMWHRAKQEISLHAAPFYGDLVARLLGAIRGLSAKVLVLDLDNTIWGGVIGDDGLDGIALGQGSAAGEAFAAVQRHAAELGRRGVILAVCSKNDESVASRAFDEHPDMVLRRGDIVSFVANWDDKASNLRRIAREVNVGLDALVFVDDNPFERNLVRGELPMVAVPEVPEDPALVVDCLAAAGYFEALFVTDDDRARLSQYRANRERQDLAETATDLDSYLRGLRMRLRWSGLTPVDLPRTVQLVNKTNQFNLTTRRITEDQARAVMDDPACVGLTFRLSDRFGDNGLIAVVIGRPEGDALRLDTWLMSCRVLGRGVEAAMLDIVCAQARAIGLAALIGEYVPSARNEMVREHYDRLGFIPLGEVDGVVRYRLPLAAPAGAPASAEAAALLSPIAVEEALS